MPIPPLMKHAIIIFGVLMPLFVWRQYGQWSTKQKSTKIVTQEEIDEFNENI